MKLSDKLLENILRDIHDADLSNDVVIDRGVVVGQVNNKKIINNKKMYECTVILIQSPYRDYIDYLCPTIKEDAGHVWTYYKYDLQIGLFNHAKFYVNFKINARSEDEYERKEILTKEIKKMFKEFNKIGELE